MAGPTASVASNDWVDPPFEPCSTQRRAAAPACVDAADTDDDGGQRPTLTDAVIIFSWLFSGGVPPAVPSPDGPSYVAENCGPDVTDDAMDCVMLSPVCQ